MTVYEGATVAVVIPAYNEEGHVGPVVETVPAYVDRIYVVEDGSTDGTWAEIQNVTRRVNERFEDEDDRYPSSFDRRVVPIRHGQNRGVGGAIKTGYLASRRDGFDVTAVMGGDGQMPPEYLADIIAPIADGRADYAKGNRLLEPEDHDEMPRFRFVGNWILTMLTKVASGYWAIGDPQNGYTAISLEALHAIDLEDMYEYYGYCNDLLVRLNVVGMRVVDVPRPTIYGDEESHIDYSEYVPRVSRMLAGNFVWRLRRKYLGGVPHPIPLLYGGSGFVALAGASLSLTTGGPGAVAAGLLLGTLLCLGAMVWDRSRERALAGRVTERTEHDAGAQPRAEPAPTD